MHISIEHTPMFIAEVAYNACRFATSNTLKKVTKMSVVDTIIFDLVSLNHWMKTAWGTNEINNIDKLTKYNIY